MYKFYFFQCFNADLYGGGVDSSAFIVAYTCLIRFLLPQICFSHS
jgi:hypothetical protein